MRYRTKLLLVFLLVAAVTNGISILIMDRLALHFYFQGYCAKLLSITATTATAIDGELLRAAAATSDTSTAPDVKLRSILRRARDANRRQDTYIRHVFAVAPSPSDPAVLIIVSDAEESALAARPGEVYRSQETKTIDIATLSAGNDFIVDAFGKSLRAIGPIRDSAGKLVGAVMIEAPAEWVESLLQPIRNSSAATTLLALLISAAAALFLSRKTSRPLVQLHATVDRIAEGDFEARAQVTSKDEFGQVAEAVNRMAAGLEERDRVKSTFARYVSHQVMDSILKPGTEVKLAGDRRRITVLFCDIRGFSTISERLRPERVVVLLNDYFDAMVEVIFRNKGTLDKFIGDGIMVIFGAPEDDPYQEEHALRTGIEMQQELQKLAEKWKAEGIDLRIGVGINSGPAVVGNIGSTRRMDYTAIGDTVNLASRLESATKELGVGILVSEYTWQALRGTASFRQMGSVQVRGRHEPVLTYTPEEPELTYASTASQ